MISKKITLKEHCKIFQSKLAESVKQNVCELHNNCTECVYNTDFLLEKHST